MIFGNNQNKNVALECKDSVRYRGVIIHSNLSWKHHIDHVAIKISQTVGFICKLRHFFPRHTQQTTKDRLMLKHFAVKRLNYVNFTQ